ncbi:MAG: VOC family protein [Pseudomonadota bacterium]|nr:VOC family protein [Pseudomonadota bacterium]
MTWHSIDAFRLVTPEPGRLARFYAALGFEIGDERSIAADEMAMLGVAGRGTRLPLTCGDSRIELDWFEVGGRPYPADTTAADTLFQHFALVTADAEVDWTRASAAGAQPISRDGPVTLPKAAGGVTAVKFRDPDGHPLELLQFPDGERCPSVVCIDHSAISVADSAASIAFYASHGLTLGKRTLNRGEQQVELDGLDGVEVDVIPLLPRVRSPHLELLAYRSPRGRPHAPLAANDVAATRLLWSANADALIRDPDGHLHQLTS